MKNPRTAFVDIAQEEIGVVETSRNQGPGIEKYWADTRYKAGYANREPYCAAFVCWVVAEASRRKVWTGLIPHDAAVRFLVQWAQRNRAILFGGASRIYAPEPGDLVYWQFSRSKAPNHIGIMVEKKGVSVVTIEANTNSAGSREGDGVYQKTRPISGTAGFIRLMP